MPHANAEASWIDRSSPSPDELAAAFETFSRASVSLEKAHEALRGRVEELSRRLHETEGRLRESLAENDRLAELAARRGRLEAMGRMAAEIVHEIRNPLGSLELTASLLREDLAGEPEKRELAVSILEGIRALTRVTGNLLSFTRSVTPRTANLDAAAVLARTRDLVAPVLAARGLDLSITPPSTPLSVRADPELLQQILLNLIQNALEATPPRGTISVAAGEGRGGDIEFLVADTGEGIDADTLLHVFDPFFTTKESGTGLGLTVSHRLAEAQQAQIEIASEPGQGTRARVIFGNRAQREEGATRPADRPPARRGRAADGGVR